MPDVITFSLRNNQMTDVNVDVMDLRNGTLALSNAPLNRGESASVQLIADSSGRGAAEWVFASADGTVNSNKRQDGIRDGDECTLG